MSGIPTKAQIALSRRAGHVFSYPPLCDMDRKTRDKVIEALQEAESFDTLPDWIKEMVIQAELYVFGPAGRPAEAVQ